MSSSPEKLKEVSDKIVKLKAEKARLECGVATSGNITDAYIAKNRSNINRIVLIEHMLKNLENNRIRYV